MGGSTVLAPGPGPPYARSVRRAAAGVHAGTRLRSMSESEQHHAVRAEQDVAGAEAAGAVRLVVSTSMTAEIEAVAEEMSAFADRFGLR